MIAFNHKPKKVSLGPALLIRFTSDNHVDRNDAYNEALGFLNHWIAVNDNTVSILEIQWNAILYSNVEVSQSCYIVEIEVLFSGKDMS